MLLEEENAVIHGGIGKVGGAVAREGAGVFLDGRTLASLVEMPLEDFGRLARRWSKTQTTCASTASRGRSILESSFSPVSGRRGLKAPTAARWRPPAASAASHHGL